MRPYDLVLPSRRVAPAEGLAVALSAERAGWRGLWCSEVLALDTIAFLAAAAARTTTLRLGTAVVPITTRSPALLAMGAATVERLAPGRFWLGLGVSTPQIVGRRHARPVVRPLDEARRTLSVVRAALRGETVDHAGRPSVEDLRIEAPEAPPPVGLAALGPKMTQLAIEAADGLFLNLCTPEDAGQRAARARRERGEAYETLMLVRLCVEPTGEQAEAVVKELSSYARVPVYERHLRQQGIDLGAVGTPSASPERARLPEDAVDRLSVLGSADECRARLDELIGLGVTPLVVPVGGLGAIERTIEALAS